MARCERTPLHRHLSNALFAVLALSVAASIVAHAKPLSNQDRHLHSTQLSEREALAPKSNDEDALSPAEDTARKLWNGVKKLRRFLQPRRYVRQVDQQDAALPRNVNATVPRYILELYHNLTRLRNSSTAEQLQHRTSQANTIRSLQIVDNQASEQSKCEQFNFSISSINTSELVMKAELHLYLDQDRVKPYSSLHVVVKSKKSLGRMGPWTEERDLDVKIDSVVNQKHVFDVTSLLYEMVRGNHTHAEFTVNFFDNDDPSNNALPSCLFVSSSSNIEKEPLLIVHSYDFELKKIGYSSILENLNRTDLARRRRAGSNINTEPAPRCGLFPLQILASEIPRSSGQEILLPSQYDAGICGGSCGQTLPVQEDVHHSQLVHFLQQTAAFRNRHDYNIRRCCAPLEYDSVEVIVETSDSKLSMLKIIPNMRIKKCECIEIIDFESSPNTTR